MIYYLRCWSSLCVCVCVFAQMHLGETKAWCLKRVFDFITRAPELEDFLWSVKSFCHSSIFCWLDPVTSCSLDSCSSVSTKTIRTVCPCHELCMEAPTMLITFFFMWQQQKKKKIKTCERVKAEADRHPLIMVVRAYCMKGKGSDWGGGKSLEVRVRVTEWKQW